MLNLLHTFARWLEDFATRHAHSISLLEAISTTSAVIVALIVSYSSKRANQPHLLARLSVMKVIYGDGRPIEEAPTYVTVRLTNIGTVPVRLRSNLFSWRVPFTKTAWLVVPMDESGDSHVQVRRYPFDLLPRTSETIFLTALDQFKSNMPHILDSGRFGRRISARLLRGILYTDDGSHFRTRLGGLRKELENLARRPPSGKAR